MHKLRLRFDDLQDGARARLHDEPTDDHLVDDPMHLLAVEDDVELAHILEMAVERLDENLDQVENAELTLGAVDDHAKVERRVQPIDHPRSVDAREPVRCVQERARVFCPPRERREKIAYHALLLLLRLRWQRRQQRCRMSAAIGLAQLAANPRRHAHRLTIEFEHSGLAKVVDD